MTHIKKIFHFVLIAIVAGALSSCAATKEARQARHKKSIETANPDFTGIASWYGPGFNGRKTASGERFNMHKLTAAHKTLPFGTVLEITNPENNKSITVKVNDRGPFIKGRVLDLSYAAAKAIGILGAGHGVVAARVVTIEPTL